MSGSGDVLLAFDQRNDDLFRWLLQHPGVADDLALAAPSRALRDEELIWLHTLSERVEKERAALGTSR